MGFEYEMSKFIPFRDAEVCRRVRAIRREDITEHPNKDFKIRVIDDEAGFFQAMATDLVDRIQRARDDGKRFVAILPVGPVPQYPIAAKMINERGLPLDHVHTFNMDEYADQDGNTAPVSWPASFQRTMMAQFFNRVDGELRPPASQMHFPTTDDLADYGKMIDDLGGADVVYGGIGWCGHIAFWEAHLGFEYGDDLESYKKAGPRLVELHPMTVMQNALQSFGGDWSWVPPNANTIGPAQILGAKDRSFWMDGVIAGGLAWQGFIFRLAAFGPVSPLVPGSLLHVLSEGRTS
jgi:glucosamine-6-phosphate deaminase